MPLLIPFKKITGEDFDAALVEHMTGPDYSKAWSQIAKGSPALRDLAIGLGKRQGVNPQVVAGLIMAGVHAGYILAEQIRDRRSIITVF